MQSSENRLNQAIILTVAVSIALFGLMFVTVGKNWMAAQWYFVLSYAGIITLLFTMLVAWIAVHWMRW